MGKHIPPLQVRLGLIKNWVLVLSLIIILLGISGCSKNKNNNSPVTGQFIDDPVQGLNYSCSSGQTGITDTNGHYTCSNNSQVTFSLGGKTIGTITTQSDFVTPYSMFPNNTDASLNLARLLQTIDADNDPDNGMITIENTFVFPDNIEFTSPTFVTDIETALSITLISAVKAQKRLHDSIKSAGGEIPDDVTVLTDTTAPVITVLGNNPVEITQGTTYTDAGATATDDVDGAVSVSQSSTVDTATIGTYTITYTATDSAGNAANATRTVNVVAPPDTAPPVITLAGDNPVNVIQGTTYTDAGATATDDVDGTVSVSQSGTVDTATVSTYTITYTATDSAGNSANATRTVNVVAPPDTTPPVITLSGDNPVEVIQGATYTDAGATATDAVDGTVSVSKSGAVDTATIGTYIITYTATDKAGNSINATRTVNVVAPPDTTPPVITLSGDNPVEVIQGATYTDAGATATDAVDGTVSVSQSGAVDTATIGTYTITYTATDKAGNSINATRTVNVVAPPDTTPPVITLSGDNPVEVIQGATYTDAGATATDAVDGTVAVNKSGTVDTATIGTYTITYTATDSAGNPANATRTVNVVAPPENNFKVTLKTSTKIAGYEIHLEFTDDTPSQNDITMDNSFLSSTGRTAGDLGPDINNDVKQIKFGGFSFGNQEGVNGDFDILTIKTKDDKSNINVINKTCIDKDANNASCDVILEKL